MAFIGIWLIVNYCFPHIAWDDKSFDILRLALTIESSFIGSLLLMSQYHTSMRDRKVIHNDYYVDLRIWQEVREIRPMIEKLYKESNKKDGLE